MEDKLKRRKLDALRRGVHRAGGGAGLPVSTHVVGIGASGIAAITEMLRSLTPGAPKLTALAVDIGGQDMAELRAVAAAVPPGSADVTMVAIDVPDRAALVSGLERYPEFLALEYPRYCWAEGYAPWLPPEADVPAAGGHFRRAVAKAVYGLAYYGGARPLQRALRDFAAGIEASQSQAVIAIVFGLGGGTGGGIAVDLARHLSTCIFGRRVLVAGIGVMPCDGDAPACRGASLFAMINELDCLGDEGKNQGVVASCGELFRNPFTAGFIMVPQQSVWAATKDLAKTHERTGQEITALLTGQGGITLWETLRLLNWVAAPSTQHSAARTPWGPKWIHMLGFADATGSSASVPLDMAERLGLLGGYAPEYIEVRAHEAGSEGAVTVSSIAAAFHPDVAPQLVDGGREGSVQFVLPCISKTDLAMFYDARDAYDGADHADRLLDHSLLLEQGVLLSEPSTRIEGMAGESLSDSGSWVAVPLSEIRGETGEHPAGTAQGVPELGYASP